ncbi:hypothetical protein [Novosphingobium sp. SG707]|uniref:hypothetical protein n=1 Tax=Novosphingobium sp. SG707 TaxID=2586996 RepID=UPI0014463599|nr:hypothetical protein [Novosphingobium sp. SG707]NKJ00377.1 hypothetical protein [Novosphingobium sp. SG707]
MTLAREPSEFGSFATVEFKKNRSVKRILIQIKGVVVFFSAFFSFSGCAHAEGDAFDIATVVPPHLSKVISFRATDEAEGALSAEETVSMLAHHAPRKMEVGALPEREQAASTAAFSSVDPAVPTASTSPDPLDERAQQLRRAQRDIGRLEIMFQVLNLADAAATISCVERRICDEKNPLYGGARPSWARVAGIKAGTGALHYMIYRVLAKGDTRLAKIFELTTVTIQGAAVLWNLTVTLK